jgi:hypothetical protein
MGELRAIKRASSGSRRRSVQGRLSIAMGDDFDVAESVSSESVGRDDGFRRPVKSSNPSQRAKRLRTPAPVFHPLAYRSVVAGWSLENREQWGRRANELEDTGLSWRDAETQAFVEMWHRVRLVSTTSEAAPVPAGCGEAEAESRP